MASGENIMKATKVADIQLSTTYPIISAYEFEFLKEEGVVRERLDGCTLYMIVQRPLTYFDNVEIRGRWIYFQIVDGINPPLGCRVDSVAAGICSEDEAVDIEVQFFSKCPGMEQPYRDVGAIKVFKEDGSFVVWWSPQKILYEMFIRQFPLEIADEGDPSAFLDFRVHYIGKAFSQKVWKRLTGHTKMQRILTLQGPVGSSPEAKAPFEISLVLLTVAGLTEGVEIGGNDFTIPPGVSPIYHEIDLDDEAALDRFMNVQFVDLGDKALTTEVEAMLINDFRPSENEIQFDRYPDIEGGMRSKGYSFTTLTIEKLPGRLYSDHHEMVAILETQ